MESTTSSTTQHHSVGGAIATEYNSVLVLNGTNKLVNNSAGTGGAIYTEINAVMLCSIVCQHY